MEMMRMIFRVNRNRCCQPKNVLLSFICQEYPLYILTPTYSSEDAKEKHKNIECQNWSLPNLGHFLLIFCSFSFFGCFSSTVGVLFHCLLLFTKLFVQPSLFVCLLFVHPSKFFVCLLFVHPSKLLSERQLLL